MNNANKHFLLLFFCVIQTFMLSAQEIYVGYCDGEIATITQGNIIGKSGSGSTIDLAIKLPTAILSEHQGNYLTGIRIGLPASSRYPGEISGWVKKEKEEETALSEGNLTSPKEGWNVIPLTTPILLTDTSSLWIGISYTQNVKLSIISLVGESHADASWISHNGKWSDNTSKGYGSLSIEGIIQGDHLPQNDILLSEGYLSSPLIQANKEIEIKGEIKNMAVQNVKRYEIICHIDDKEQYRQAFECDLSYREKTSFSLTIPSEGIAPGQHTFSLTASLTDGLIDETPDNNKIDDLTLHILSDSFVRKVLVEKFTTEKCNNCPNGAAILEEAISSSSYRDNILCVNHHTGYGDDWLTIDASREYTWLYSPTFGPTYAPALMINRIYHSDAPDAYSDSPVFSITNAETVRKIFEREAAKPALVQLLIASHTENEKVIINITGEKVSSFDDVCPAAMLHVWIKENDITAQSQAGAEGGFTHHDVIRQALSSVWGDAVSWEGNSFHVTYETTIEPTWVKNNLSVIAFISSASSTQRTANQIYNAAGCRLEETNRLTSPTATPQIIKSEYHTLSGTKTLPGTPGLYLRTDHYQDGTIQTSKIIF